MKKAITRNKEPNKVGDVFGNLTIVAPAKPASYNNAKRFVVECICGRFIEVFQANLRTGNQESCGCIFRKRLAGNKTSHGLSRTNIYSIWAGIRSRCYNPNAPMYHYYGGRGIRMADEWKEDAKAFADHVGKRPSPRHSIHRIDGDGNYEPGNVKWATPEEQNRNKSNSIFLTVRGETRPLAEWCEIFDVSHYLVRSRVQQLGWDHERALQPPTEQHTPFVIQMVEIGGIEKTVREWCQHFGTSEKVAHSRAVCHDWSLQEAVSRPVRVRRPSKK